MPSSAFTGANASKKPAIKMEIFFIVNFIVKRKPKLGLKNSF
jgi:hypothetical protein